MKIKIQYGLIPYNPNINQSFIEIIEISDSDAKCHKKILKNYSLNNWFYNEGYQKVLERYELLEIKK